MLRDSPHEHLSTTHHKLEDEDATPSHQSTMTFSFRIGRLNAEHCVLTETSALSLSGTTVNFRSGALHDAIYVDGRRYGGRAGDLTEATVMEAGARIARVRLGISTYSLDSDWGGGLNGAFTDLHLTAHGHGGGRRQEHSPEEEEAVEVSAELLDELS